MIKNNEKFDELICFSFKSYVVFLTSAWNTGQEINVA